MINELVRTRSELEGLAELMSKDVSSGDGNAVVRYAQVTHDAVNFLDGKRVAGSSIESNLNKEQMCCPGVYTVEGVDRLTEYNYKELVVARDLQPLRFQFAPKEIDLPTEEAVFYSPMPENIETYDEEFREFSRTHPNTILKRTFSVDQRIVVNNKGGKMIQSTPFLGVSFYQGYQPIPVSRDISVVCATDEDVKRMSSLVKYLSDPTQDKRIQNSKSFTEAFHNLSKISDLRYGSLEDAGIPLSELYDVVMLTGVPVHEIFGHHFEEPVRFLEFGESGTFKLGQNISNKGIALVDNPAQRINGFGILGFTNFDAYGRRRQARKHIENGKVVGFLGSEYADNTERLKQYMNVDKSYFVGNATQSSNGSFPQPRMSCTVLDGPTTKNDLEGKILLVPHEGHTVPTDKTYLVKSFECYVVKDGEPRRIIPLQVTGGINQALGNMELLDDVSYQTGMCGKSDPVNPRYEARVPVSQLCKSQIWKGQQVYPLPISDAHLRVLSRGK